MGSVTAWRGFWRLCRGPRWRFCKRRSSCQTNITYPSPRRTRTQIRNPKSDKEMGKNQTEFTRGNGENGESMHSFLPEREEVEVIAGFGEARLVTTGDGK